jgi:3-oxoacyl-[acyl-carrier-protein] synthase II
LKRRVVITGIGIVSPLGIGTEENWQGISEGKSGIGYITHFDASDYPVKIAGEVKGFDPLNFIEKKDLRKMDLHIQYALASTEFALKDADLSINSGNSERIGVFIGSGIGGLNFIESQHKILLKSGPRRISPFFIPGLIVNLAAGHVSIKFGAKGPNSATCTACSSGAHAIGDSCRIIERGDADAMITGGTEGVVAPLAVAGFSSMRALSTRNDEPEKASRPFDNDRDGFVIGEGAGILILEELEGALKRGAKIYAEIVGYGMSGDAYHISAPSEDGDGPIRAMIGAIKDASVEPSEVDYINAHGTATPPGDKIESLAIKKLFGPHAKKIPVSSNKSMIGHLLGAAGGVEAVFSVLTIHNQIIPPTINYQIPDPDCDLDFVPNKSRKAEINYVLSNSFGFGGTNACLLFKKFNK